MLFVSWDGPGSSYLSSLFLPIFQALRGHGFRFHVLQFGWSEKAEVTSLTGMCEAAGIPYRSARVWRRPLSVGSLASAMLGSFEVRKCIRDWDIDLIMPRSYLPALAAVGGRQGLPLMLDADGLPNDERVEFAGISERSISHRLLSRIERWAVRSADAVTVRTARAANILAERAGVDAGRFVTIRNARDASHFRPLSDQERLAVREKIGVEPHAPLIAYVGSSLAGKYCGEAVVAFANAVLDRRPDARLLLVVTDAVAVRTILRSDQMLRSATIIRSSPSHEVARLVGAADLGLSLIRQTQSMEAASAIKTGEYLLCGIPILATSRVGGIENWLSSDAGHLLNDTSKNELEAAADWFVEKVLPMRNSFARAARRAGEEQYGIDGAINDYVCALRIAIKRHFSWAM